MRDLGLEFGHLKLGFLWNASGINRTIPVSTEYSHTTLAGLPWRANQMPPKQQPVAHGLRLARARLKPGVAGGPLAVAPRPDSEPKACAFGRLPPPSFEGESYSTR